MALARYIQNLGKWVIRAYVTTIHRGGMLKIMTNNLKKYAKKCVPITEEMQSEKSDNS